MLLDSSLPQLDHLFDYEVPLDLIDTLRVGHRVRVPFRSQSRRSHGYVISLSDHSEFAGELQLIAEIVGTVPPLTAEIWRLARTLADRAAGSASDILRLAIPQRMVRAEKQHLAALDAAARPGAAEATDVVEGAENALTVEQPEITESAERSAFAETTTQGTQASDNADGADQLAHRLILGERFAFTPRHAPERLSTGEWVGSWAVQLAELAIAVFALERSVILVAPDYRDVDQLHDALAALGHDDTVRVDARQSGSARYASFLRARDETPRIILGNRSAIYAPAHRLGAVLMWDDGDPLLAEPLSPYVHARDAALVRSSLAEEAAEVASDGTPGSGEAIEDRAGLVFAAHARSTEVQRLIDLRYLTAAGEPARAARIIAGEAMAGAADDTGRVPEVAARALREGLRSGPVLVQVASPGYAPVARCAQCRARVTCPRCAGPIAFRGRHHAACRWCGEQVHSWSCPECGSHEMMRLGAGSRRTAEQFAQQFDGVRVILSDGEHPHERVDSRPALVVATRGAEPIAAGGYQAVVLLDAERLLAIESLRAAEDCLRWWMNAASLAASDAPVILAGGGGPLVQAIMTGRVVPWLQAEISDRKLLRYPPAVRVASVTGGAPEVERAISTLADLPGVDVIGPAPAESPDAGARLVRAIVRFDYAQGTEVAKRLRGALVADAAGSSSRIAGRSRGRARAESLRLRCDDRGVFDGTD